MIELDLPRPRDVFLGIPRARTRSQSADVRLHLNEWSEPHALDEHLDAAELRGLLLNRYGDVSAKALRLALAELWQVRPEEVLPGNGSMEVFLNTLIAYGGPGRTLLVFPPTYITYRDLGLTSYSPVLGRSREQAPAAGTPKVCGQLCQFYIDSHGRAECHATQRG